MVDDGHGLTSDESFGLFVLLAQTKDAILRARQMEYAPYGISNERRALLWVIQSYGGEATPSEIGRRFFRELQSITEMLKRMEKAGLVSKRQGSGRAKTVVKLTEKGSETLRQSLHNETDKRILSVLTPEERDQLAVSLSKLRMQALAELGVTDVELSVQFVPRKRPESSTVR
jgi:DNA-binding MarR family transcriptional regulator